MGVDLYLAGDNNKQSNNDNAPSTSNTPAYEKLSDYITKKDDNCDNYDNKCRPKARLFVVDDDPNKFLCPQAWPYKKWIFGC